MLAAQYSSTVLPPGDDLIFKQMEDASCALTAEDFLPSLDSLVCDFLEHGPEAGSLDGVKSLTLVGSRAT